jgi:hypothetical protein
MRAVSVRRAAYRVRQFVAALVASHVPLVTTDEAKACRLLPPGALGLFQAMPRVDQRHSLSVVRALEARGEVHPALLQAALLHDCAKHVDGVRLWHRVVMVLLKALLPEQVIHWQASGAPPRKRWHYPIWSHLHHPERGAEMAAAAGCEPLVVTLIRHHQDSLAMEIDNPAARQLLAALQWADDGN